MPSYLDGVVTFHMRDPATLEAVCGTMYRTSLGPVALFDTPPHGSRYTGIWVVLRTVDESVHRIGGMPEYSPMENRDDPFMDWLYRHRSVITERWHYAGAWVFHLQPIRTLPGAG